MEDLSVAPDSERVDLAEPSSSDPTNVTNPLHPTGARDSELLLGNSDGHPLRDITLLPETKTIALNGRSLASSP